MTNLRDAYDQPVTTTSQTALEHYIEGIDCIITQNTGAEEALTAAIQADDSFALAHAALALAMQQSQRPDDARAAIDHARERASGLSRREASHVEIIGAQVEGKPAQALQMVAEHLAEFPRDAAILYDTRLLNNVSGRLTRKEEMLALFRSLAGEYGEDPWFLGCHAFVENELFHFEVARPLAERSFAKKPKNSDCAHSIAHVMFETADHDSGSAFLSGFLDGSPWQRNRSGHLSWHRALFEIQRGCWDEVEKIYETTLKPGKHPGGNQITIVDGASLMWRYRLHGLEPTVAIDDLCDFARERFPRAGNAFADVHKAMAFALAGDTASLQALASELRDLVAADKLPAGPVVPAAVDAIAAFGSGDYEAAIEALEPYAGEISRVGGSHAQFDVINDTLLAAYVHTGRCDEAEPLLRERLDRRPCKQDEFWLRCLEATRA